MLRLFGLLLAAVLLVGCSTAPAVRPVGALETVLQELEVAVWYQAHSAPAVLSGMDARQARRWRLYKPAAMVDLVKEGLQVRLQAQHGPAPREAVVLLDRRSGQVLSVTMK